jgi:mannose-1-phosphate guanylyltransferase/phosphomannomutase
MKAMVLCAGFGTRLGELTQETPKPMLKAAGVPLADYILTNLRNHGFTQVMVNLHYHAEKIRNGLQRWSNKGVALSFSFEDVLLGTAGAVKKVEAYFAQEELFLVQYGDVVTDVDLTKMVEFHRKKNALGTLLVHQRRKSNSAITLDEQACIRRFVERPPEEFWETVDQTWVNSGLMLFSPRVLDYVPESGPADWPRDVFPSVVSQGGLYAFPLEGSYRVAVDSMERLSQLERDIETGQFPALKH